jgi:hypothetical protein
MTDKDAALYKAGAEHCSAKRGALKHKNVALNLFQGLLLMTGKKNAAKRLRS